MQVAGAYLNSFSAIPSQDSSKDRIVPIVTTVAVHALILLGIVVSTGIVPLSKPEPQTQVVPVPPPVEQNPERYDDSVARGEPVLDHYIPTVKTPEIDVEASPPIAERGSTGGGGGMVDRAPVVFTQIRLLSSFQPEYPSISRMRSEEGVVTVRVTITPFGTVGAVELEKSSGFARLDAAALKAVREWTFAPAKRGGEAISASVLVPVKFEIK